MCQGENQRQVKYHIGHHRDNADFNRRFGVLPCEIPRRQHLDQHEGQQPGGVCTQALGRHGDVAIGNFSVVEQSRNQWLSQKSEGQRGRQTYKQHRPHSPVQRCGKLVCRFRCVFAGQTGKNHRGNSDTEYTQGQLRQAIRVVKPGHTAGLQKRRKNRVQKQIDLADRNPEQRRHHQLHDATDPFVPVIHFWPRHQP